MSSSDHSSSPPTAQSPASVATARETRWLTRYLSDAGRLRRFVIYLPAGYDAQPSWPLIVFLHGKGETGDDGVAQTRVGLGPALRRSAERFPAVVLFPQCPTYQRWTDMMPQLDRVLEATLGECTIDRSRIYLTGISMGGFGTWHYGARRSELFAALAPVCGGGNAADAPALAKLPIWAFHGAADPVVDVTASREMVQAVERASGTIRYTEYEGEGHACWDRVYADAALSDWLFAQRRG